MIKKSFKKSLLTGASAFALGAFASTMAFADADLDATASDYTGNGTDAVESVDVTLAGNETSTGVGITLSSAKNLDTGGKNLKGAGAGNAVTTDAGVDNTTSTGTTLTVSASSTVTAANTVDAVDIANSIAGITVAGTITGATTGDGIDLGATVTDGVTVSSTGKVQSATNGYGIITTAAITAGITNAGTITSGGTGGAVSVATGALTGSITNTGTFSSTGASTAGVINVDQAITGSIVNSGTISTAVAGIAIDVGAGISGGISNSGTVSGASGDLINISAAATADITNTGSITASGVGKGIDVANKLTGTITNGASGTTTSSISSAAGVAVDLAADVTGGLINWASISETTGSAIDVSAAVATGGIDNKSGATIKATTGVGIDIGASLAGELTNAGTVTTAAGAAIKVTGAATTDITNSGTISDTGAGIAIDVDAALTGTITNSGSISSASGIVIDLDGTVSAITNTGTITASGATAAIDVAANSGTITNSGSMTSVGGNGVIDVTGAATGAITNSGTIQNTGTGADAGIDIGATLTGAITNSGTITTAGTSGAIAFTANADVTGNITNSGTISSTNATPVAIDGSGATGTAVTVTNSGTLTGAVKLGQGWTLTNTGTITGNISDGDDGADTMNWNAGTITGTIDLGSEDGDTLNVGDDTSDSISTGGAISGLSDLNVKEGTFSIGHAITLTETTISDENFVVESGGTAKVTTSLTVNAGDIDVNGTLNVANGVDLTVTSGGAGRINSSASGNLTFGISKNSDFGQIVATEGTNVTELAGGSTITFDVSNGSEMITAGELVDVIAADSITVDGVALTGTTTGLTFSDDSYVLGFALSTNSNATGLDVTVTRANAYNTATSLANESAVGAALETIANTGDTGIDAIVGTLDSFTTAAQVEAALETLNPEMSGAINAAAVGAADAGFGVVGNRLDQLAGISGTGVAAGGMSYNSGVWGEVFGTAADQGDRKGVKGYQADTVGFSIGGDTAVNDKTKVGASFAYASTEADSANGETEIDSYQVSVYGSQDYGKWFADGLLGVTFNNFDLKRNVVVGAISNQAKADFDGQQYSIKVGGGYKLDVEGGLNVTPVASLKYDYLALDKYTETGSTANLTVDNEDLHILKSDIGVKLNYPIVDGSMTYIPEISTSWTYDLVGDEQEAKNNFVGAASTQFTTKGAKVAQHQFNVGLGLDVLAQDNVTVSFDYDWASKEDYNSHSGAVKARFAF